MPSIGMPELLIILAIVVILFGVGRLGEAGGALGKGIREFRKSVEGDYDEPPKEPPTEPKKEMGSGTGQDGWA
jgi:sec-independent protein translocase protein TatA